MYLIDFKQKEEMLTYYPFLSAIFIKNLLFSIGSFCLRTNIIVDKPFAGFI